MNPKKHLPKKRLTNLRWPDHEGLNYVIIYDKALFQKKKPTADDIWLPTTMEERISEYAHQGTGHVSLLAGDPARRDVTVIRWWVFGVTSE